jgi:MFS family permease
MERLEMSAELITRPVPAAEPARRGRPWPMLAVLLFGQFMALLDVYIVNVAMPTIGVDLHASGSALQLVVAGYTVAYAMLLITGARLGTMYGRRRMYLVGVLGFTVSSLVCGLAPNVAVLIAFRFAQGAAAAVLVPQIISVIQLRFTGKARAKALSVYTALLAVGSLVGLVLGGVLVSASLFGLGWRPVFMVNVPIGLLLAVLVPRLVPADRPTGARRLDLVGLAVAVPAVLLVVLPLVLGHDLGWPVWTFGCIVAGLVLAALFVAVERRVAARGRDPLLNLAVLRAPGMASGLVALSCAMIPYGGFVFVFALHLQSGLGDGALRAALTLMPFGATFGLVAYCWRRLPDRLHAVLPPVGLVLCAVSAVAIGLGVHGGGQIGPVVWGALVLYGAGLGLTVSLLTHALTHVPPARAADASGLLTTTMQLGQVTGIAVFGTVFLSLVKDFPTHSAARAVSSADALAATAYWLIPLSVLGAVAGIVLARTLSRPSPAPAVTP